MTLNPLDFLVDGPAPEYQEWVWATVTATNPVRIKIDGDENAQDGTPDSLIDPHSLFVGDRVRVQFERAIHLGQSGARMLIIGAGSGGVLGLRVGMIFDWPGANLPTGYLWARGGTASRKGFPALFAAYGTTYGAGDGSTTFGLPDRRGRVGVGKGDSGTFVTLGAVGGAETHLLTTAQMPSHTHTLTGMFYNSARYAPLGEYLSGDVNSAQTKTTDATGGGTAHNNLQPYQVTNYIILAG